MWYLIFCFIIGILMAVAAEWVAKAIDQKKDWATIGWRLIVFGWVTYFAALGFTANYAISADKEIKELKERVAELEKMPQVDTVYLKDLLK